MVTALSKGQKQRVQLARVLLLDPKVLILDEPASDLDPRARIEIRDLLVELRSMGKTIFLSSHILTELADVCTSVAIVEETRRITQIDRGLSAVVQYPFNRAQRVEFTGGIRRVRLQQVDFIEEQDLRDLGRANLFQHLELCRESWQVGGRTGDAFHRHCLLKIVQSTLNYIG